MSIQPGTYNFELQRRADYSLSLQFKDSNDVAIDLTGYTVYAQAWDASRSTKHADFSVSYTSRTNGEIELTLSHSQTSVFPGELYYDVMLEAPSGKREYYLEGKIFISEGYTTP